MAEEKQTPEVEDNLSRDDTDALRYVIEHTRGTTAVSLYEPLELFDDEEPAA